MTAIRMTSHRLAILCGTTERTAEGERIHYFDGEAWDRATSTKVTAVVTYLITRGLVAAQRLEERNGKTVIRYTPTTARWKYINEEKNRG